MTIVTYTLLNIAIIETVFFIAETIIKRRKKLSGFVTTFVLGLIVLYFSFGGAIASLLRNVVQNGGALNLLDVVLLFFNMFYGYLRGLSRIASINKKYGNL